MNFLEELASEWYEFRGYFVRSNVRARRRKKGGWDRELDVLAYQPSTGGLLHIEVSGDALSWKARKERFLTQKFDLTQKEYEELVDTEVGAVKKIAIVGFGRSTRADLNWGKGIEVILASRFIRDIAATIRSDYPMTMAIPESYPILRAFQAVLYFGLDDGDGSRSSQERERS
jgi:hypothetical protein